MINLFYSTPYSSVNVILTRLLTGVMAVLGDQFTGLYLHGSLAYDDFNPQTSDIDFLVVTKVCLSTEVFFALKELHSCIFTSGLDWSQKLEGAYIPKAALGCYDPAHPEVPWLGVDGHFVIECLGSDWVIQRWILREKGIAVFGPPLQDIIDPVSAKDLQEAVRGSLREWWSPPFPLPERFQSDEYRAYTVLTMCRSLYILEHGRISSKYEAARRAIKTLDELWTGLINKALHWRIGMKFDTLEETMNFIRFTHQRAGILPEDVVDDHNYRKRYEVN